MMESCLSLKPERAESVVVEDLKKDLLADFSAIPNDVTEKEHLRVYLRVRPFTSAEIDSGESQECVKIELPDTVLYKAPRPSLSARLSDKSVSQTAQRFQFSQVFGPETTQKEIFDGTVKGLVKDVLEGGNTLVFTYGVTNAGKTFTFLGSDSDGGILPRSLNLIFSSIEERIYTQMNIKPHRCREFTRLTKVQQDEEAANKRNIMRFFKESECQKSMTGQPSTCRATLLEGSTTSNTGVFAEENSFSLDVDTHTKFSVWVSFCEIYNENIHDLLEPVSGSSMKRSMLRLSQDVKGNSFVKDLKWIQVNDADEAYRVLKLGKKNQSFSCTKLNNLSSRSHCIFSIRLIRIEDVGIPRVHTISELSLCDLAGSERCAKTHNKGDRLKEAGNINTSLLILGKCINALRRNQQSKLQQHVPFRESKLTQYLQGFFCGRGKASMIVNVNQCASMFDETLNVLKFSAVAQKVVVLNTKPLPVVPKKSVREVSFIIDNADQRNLWAKRKSSLVGWERGLEDVQEDDDDDDDVVVDDGGDEDEAVFDEESYAESMMEDTIQEADETEIERETYDKLVSLTQELQAKICKAESEKLTLETCIREEVTKEFMELFSNMEKDYNERLLKEKEIIEERAEKRMEIWKTLVNRIAGEESKEDKLVSMDEMIETMQDDLAKIKRDAEAAHVCLSLPDPSSAVTSLEKQLAELSEELLKTQELLTLKSNETQQTCEQLEEMKRNLEAKTLKFQELMEICQEKDDMITKLQTAMDQHVETITNGRIFIDDIKEEMLQLRKNCRCLNREGESSQKEGRKRSGNFSTDLDGEPPLKKALEEERCVSPTHTDKLQTECDQKDIEVMQLREKCKGLQERMESAEADFLNAITLKDEQMDQLKESQLLLEGKVEKLVKDLWEQTCACETAKSSLCLEQKEKDRLVEEREALGKEKDGWQQESNNMAKKIDALQQELDEEKKRAETVTEELKAAKVLLVERNNDSWEKAKMMESLTKETDALKKQLEKQGALSSSGDSDHFHETMDALRQECEKVVKESAQKTQQIEDLERDINSLRKQASEQEQIAGQLNEELAELRRAQGDLAELEAERRAAAEMKRSHAELEVRVAAFEGQAAELEEQVKVAGANASKAADLEKQLLEKETQMVALRATLSELQEKLAAVESECLQEARRKEAERRRDLLKAAEDAIAEKDAELARRAEELSRIKEEMISSSDKVKSLTLELQRKEDDDLKEKLADSKKQIQQVQKEIEYLREEQTSLKRKLNESEKAKSQLLTNLSSKDTLIQQLKNEQASNARSKEDLQRYQKSCDDLRAKEQIIENMRLALKEQEDTQEEQDRVLEAQLEEIDSLNEQLQKLKENVPPESNEGGESGNSEEESLRQFLAANQEIVTLKETLEKSGVPGVTGEQEKRELLTSMQRKTRSKPDVSGSGETAGQTDLASRHHKAEDQIKENSAVLEAMTLLHSELALVRSEICNKIDEKIRDLSASLRGEIATLKAENKAAVTALKGKMDSQKQSLKELADSATCTSGSAVEPENKLTKEKLQADRKTWHEEKMILIGHAKEAEEKRIQEMKKFAEDRERYTNMQTAMEKLSRQLSDKDADLAKWRKERDSLVAALEVQLTKLAAINTKKDEQITELLKKCSLLPQETNDKIESFQHILSVKESEIAALREQLTMVSNNGQETSPVSKRRGELRKSTDKNEPPGSSNTRQNIRSSQASEEQEASVLDSSEISTESGRTSRFPKPELEIQFTPLQPNKLNLRRQGGDSVTVKITRAARKRKSAEMDKDLVNSENKKNNMRITRMTKDNEKKSPAAFSRTTHTRRDESQSSLRNRKDGALQKIGDFLQSSPNLLGSKAKKIMELVQSKSPEPEGDSTLGLKPKKSKRKLYKTEISSPLDIPSNPIILPDEEKESDHIIIKRRLRTRTGKKY